MSASEETIPALAENSKRFVKRLVSLGSNRIELLLVEIEEERQHLLRTTIMAMLAGVLALLCVMGFSAAIVLAFWDTHPIAALSALSAAYGCVSLFLFQRVVALRREWKILPATLDQLRKDGECLEKILS